MAVACEHEPVQLVTLLFTEHRLPSPQPASFTVVWRLSQQDMHLNRLNGEKLASARVRHRSCPRLTASECACQADYCRARLQLSVLSLDQNSCRGAHTPASGRKDLAQVAIERGAGRSLPRIAEGDLFETRVASDRGAPDVEVSIDHRGCVEAIVPVLGAARPAPNREPRNGRKSDRVAPQGKVVDQDHRTVRGSQAVRGVLAAGGAP